MPRHLGSYRVVKRLGDGGLGDVHRAVDDTHHRDVVIKTLDASRGMGKEEERPVESGVTVRTLSFERLVEQLAADHQLFVLDRKGIVRFANISRIHGGRTKPADILAELKRMTAE